MNASQLCSDSLPKQAGLFRTACLLLALLLGVALVPATAMAQTLATWRVQVWEQSDGGAYDQFAPFCETGAPCTAVAGLELCIDATATCQTTAGSPAVAVFSGLSLGPHTVCLSPSSWLAVSGSSGAPLDGENCVTRDFTGNSASPDQTTAIYVEQNVVEITVTKAYTVDHPTATDPEVSLTLYCSSGTVSLTDPNEEVPLGLEVRSTSDNTTTTTGGSASFWVSGFTAPATCYVTEVVPAGYVQSANTCGTAQSPGLTLPGDGTLDCTITNRPTEATFTVNKNFSDSNPNLQAAVTPLCTDAGGGPGMTYTPANGNATHGTNFVTTVKYFNVAADCTASEVDLVGYTQDLAVSTCDTNTAISDVTDGTCIIHNQQDPVDIYADKIFTSGGGSATFAIDNCGGQGTVTVDTNSASPGSPAHYIISNFPYNGTTCNVTEPTPPDGYYEVASTCNGLLIVPSDDDTTCGITNAPTRAEFEVTKEFTDGDNPTSVEVTLSCFTGLPLVQSQDIDETQEVTFVVESFTHEALDCEVSEDLDAPELAGYTPTYTAGGTPGGTDDEDGCYFDDVPGGAENTCHIVNDADPVPVVIEKDWIIEGMGGDQVNQYFELTLYCDADIVDGYYNERSKGKPGCGAPFKGDSQWTSCLELSGNGDTTFTPEVIPEWPSSHCWVDEEVYDDAVEVDNDCGDINVSHGEGDSCLITNTVFFEGIPTLSQYGMAIMALLMLGVGLVGFRRL
jgi:hypothetical protein